MDKFELKELEKKDLEPLLEMVRELATYENMLTEVKATQEEYEESIFKNRYVKVLILKHSEKYIGYAMYYFTFSSFLGFGGIYLEDLYIRQEYRRNGYAREVFKYLATVCKDNNLKRLEWVCLNDNQLGIDFYESLNASNLSKEWRMYRLEEENIDKLSKL